jgi:hypothetical protein
MCRAQVTFVCLKKCVFVYNSFFMYLLAVKLIFAKIYWETRLKVIVRLIFGIIHYSQHSIWPRVRQMWPACNHHLRGLVRSRCALQTCILFVWLMLPHHFCPTLMTLLGKLSFPPSPNVPRTSMLLYTHAPNLHRLFWQVHGCASSFGVYN